MLQKQFTLTPQYKCGALRQKAENPVKTTYFNLFLHKNDIFGICKIIVMYNKDNLIYRGSKIKLQNGIFIF